MVQWVKDLPAMQETQKTFVQSLGGEDPLEGKMATHSSILAWEIPEEPGGLQSKGSQSETSLSMSTDRKQVLVIFAQFKIECS